jgi:PQQ-like domain
MNQTDLSENENKTLEKKKKIAPLFANIAVCDGKLYAVGQNGRVYAFNPRTEVWMRLPHYTLED